MSITPTTGHDVRGRCPACGHRSLFVGSGGWLTCSNNCCPNPTALADILEAVVLHHVVTLRAEDFAIEHPLLEKLNGSLHQCPLDRYLHGLTGPPRQLGRYEVHGDVTDPDDLFWHQVPEPAAPESTP